jgi:hypothetical protein
VGSKNGLRAHKHSALNIAFTSWQTMTLFVFKTLVNWVFGLAFALYIEGVEIKIPQVCYLAIALTLLASWATVLALWRPEGPMPATFGHLPTLVDLIDEWPCRLKSQRDADGAEEAKFSGLVAGDSVILFWGDKGADENGLRKAGTAYGLLGPIVMDARYL